MRKALLTLIIGIILTFVVSDAWSETFYFWRYREASTCNTLTGGKAKDLCKQTSDNTLWTCVPTSGDCDTADEWVKTSSNNVSGWTDQGLFTELTTASDNVVIGSTSNIAKLNVAGDIRLDGGITSVSTDSQLTGGNGEVIDNEVDGDIKFAGVNGSIGDRWIKMTLDGSNAKLSSDQDIYIENGLGLLEAGSTPTYHTILRSADLTSSNLSFTLPAADGTAGQAIITDGAGNLSFYTITGGGGTGAPGGADTHVQFNDTGSFGGESAFTYDKTNDTLSLIGSADAKRLILKAHSTQTSPLLEAQDSTGATKLQVSGSGYVSMGTTASTHYLDISQVGNSTSRNGINISAQPDAFLDLSANTGADEAFDNKYEAFMFTPTTTMSYGYLRFKIKSNTQAKEAGQLMVRIYSNSTVGGYDHPSSWVAFGGSYPDIGSFGTTYTEYITPINNNLTAGTKYWLVIANSNSEVTSTTLYFDSAATGTGVYAYSPDGVSTNWTVENNKSLWIKLHGYNSYNLVAANVYSPPLVISGQSQPAASFSSLNDAVRATTSSRFAALKGTSRHGQGILGNCSQTNTKTPSGLGVCAGVQGTAKAGFGGWFGQQTTLDVHAEDDVLYAEKSGTLGSYESTGTLIRGKETVASTGDLLEIQKGTYERLKITAEGDMKIGGDVVVADVDEVGSEKITNGTFTGNATGWTLAADWSYSTNKVTHTIGTTTTLSQPSGSMVSAPVVGEVYYVSYQIVGGTYSQRMNGSIVVSFAGQTLKKVRKQDTYYHIVKATTTDGIVFTPSSDFEGGIDNVSVVRITGGDMKVVGDMTVYGAIYLDGTAPTYTYLKSPDGSWSRCGVDNADVFSCVGVTLP